MNLETSAPPVTGDIFETTEQGMTEAKRQRKISGKDKYQLNLWLGRRHTEVSGLTLSGVADMATRELGLEGVTFTRDHIRTAEEETGIKLQTDRRHSSTVELEHLRKYVTELEAENLNLREALESIKDSMRRAFEPAA